MKTLHLTKDKNLSLPLEAATQTFSLLAKRGVGKTHTASVMAEEFVAAKLPFVVLDPTGAWWGLRASKDDGPGLPVVIIGGAHGDLPLEPTGGKLVADIVVDHPGFYVVDLSMTKSNAEQDRFATDFAERLYRRKQMAREPLHLFVDEADSFVPQRPFPGQQRMLGAFEALVRRGRIYGIGVTLISQRPAVINKNVLSQTEVLVALQTTAPQDRAAIEAWAEGHGTPEQVKELMGSLASLKRGEAWIWSPSWLETFLRVQIRDRHTFNSSATPKIGERRQEPKALASVDIEQLRKQMADTIERTKAEDPKALLQRIAELEKQLKDRPEPKVVKTGPVKVERIEVPVIGKRAAIGIVQAAKEIRKAVSKIQLTNRALDDALVVVDKRVGELMRTLDQLMNTTAGGRPTALATGTSIPARRPGQATAPTTPQAGAGNGAGAPLRSGALRILRELAARHPAGYSRSQVGALTGFAPSGGTFTTYLGDLKRGGYIEERTGLVYAAGAAFDLLGTDVPAAPTTHEDIMAMWRKALRAGAYRMLEAVVAAGQSGMTRQDLASTVNMEVTGGTFTTYLGDLRRNGLVIDEGGCFMACDILFLGYQGQA